VTSASFVPEAGLAEHPLVLRADHAATLALTADVLTGKCFVVGSAGDGCELLAEVERLYPDVIVLDITMLDQDGIEAPRQLKRAGCRAKLVFPTVHEDPDYVRTASHADGTAYVVKACLPPNSSWPSTKPSKNTASFRQ
jgi:DNA-binding NarL/FixJ family response regulator